MSLARVWHDGQSWKVEFDGWRALPRDRKRLLLFAVGDCGGEWWGQGTQAGRKF